MDRRTDTISYRDARTHLTIVLLSMASILTGCAVTAKAHYIMTHIVQFYGHTSKGLRRFSEQTFERLHSCFAEFVKYRLRTTQSDPEYLPGLLKCVKEFNVLRLL